MITQVTRERVRKLHAQGFSIRRIARQLGMSRNSIRQIVRGEKPNRERHRASLLDPHKPAIRKLIEDEALERRRNPRKKPLTTKRILKEIRNAGYCGGRTILDEFLRELRGPTRRSRKPYVRFETAMAEEAQQDWSPYRVLIAGRETVIQLFSLILCWSRYQFFQAFLSQKQGSLLHGHVAAFKYFQGVPWRVVYDRQATITPCEIAGKPIIHESFQRFADHYGFKVHLCRPGDKERKGKVERPFQLFETSFLPLRTFHSLEDLNEQLRGWLDGREDPHEGNHRRHGTTGEVPYQRWLEEKALLYDLPRTDLLPRRLEQREVNHDCTISVLGNLYTVPAGLVERGVRSVWVSIGADDLQVYDKGGELVAKHRLDAGKGRLVIDEDHYRDIKRLKGPMRLADLDREFLQRFPASGDFLKALKETLQSIAPIHIREILFLARRYRPAELEEALATALSHGTATVGYVREILARKYPTGHVGETHEKTPRGLSLGPISPGDAGGYGIIFEEQERREADDADSTC
jgi:transposase